MTGGTHTSVRTNTKVVYPGASNLVNLVKLLRNEHDIETLRN
jgi:hypothetical protein